MKADLEKLETFELAVRRLHANTEDNPPKPHSFNALFAGASLDVAIETWVKELRRNGLAMAKELRLLREIYKTTVAFRGAYSGERVGGPLLRDLDKALGDYEEEIK